LQAVQTWTPTDGRRDYKRSSEAATERCRGVIAELDVCRQNSADVKGQIIYADRRLLAVMRWE
jgi:hypothetical protein